MDGSWDVMAGSMAVLQLKDFDLYSTKGETQSANWNMARRIVELPMRKKVLSIPFHFFVCLLEDNHEEIRSHLVRSKQSDLDLVSRSRYEGLVYP